MYIYPRATVTVNIYTVTVARVYNILIISGSLVFFSLFSICTTNYPSSCSFFLWYTLPQTQNQKSTTNIKNQPQNQQQNQPLEQNRLIGDRWLWIVDWKGDLDRCWWRSVMGWRRSVRSVLMEIGFNGDRCWWSAWDGLTEISVDGVLVMVLLGWRRLVDWRGVVVLVMVVVLMESLLWCLWVLTVRERRRKKMKKRKRKR